MAGFGAEMRASREKRPFMNPQSLARLSTLPAPSLAAVPASA
jgi:hypothetical protein